MIWNPGNGREFCIDILKSLECGLTSRGKTLGDDVVADATIDRLVHHAHVIALDGDSYRTRAHRKGPPPAANTKTK